MVAQIETLEDRIETGQKPTFAAEVAVTNRLIGEPRGASGRRALCRFYLLTVRRAVEQMAEPMETSLFLLFPAFDLCRGLFPKGGFVADGFRLP